MHRNLVCWSAVLVGYILVLLWGNSEPVRIVQDADHIWAHLWWDAAPLRSVASSGGNDGGRPVRPPPPPPPPEIKRQNAEEVIHNSACRTQAEKIVPLLRSCVRVSAVPVDDMNLIEPGASRFASEPDVPAGFTWPEYDGRPLRLLAQIRLSDVAPYDEAHALPESGWLLFFHADGDEPPTGAAPEHRGAWRVVYLQGEAATLERRKPPGEQVPAFPPCKLRFWREWSLPPVNEVPSKIINRWNCDQVWYEEVRFAISGRPKEPACHRLVPPTEVADLPVIAQLAAGGTVWSQDLRAEDPALAAKLAGRAEWVTLLEFESEAVRAFNVIPDPNSRMPYYPPRGDVVYFMIRQPDLEAREFGRVWAVRPEAISWGRGEEEADAAEADEEGDTPDLPERDGSAD